MYVQAHHIKLQTTLTLTILAVSPLFISWNVTQTLANCGVGVLHSVSGMRQHGLPGGVSA